MINCPNCNKKVNKRFEYCRICGSKLNGDNTGDFSTEINNLFKDDDGFYYLFAVNGKQVILKNENEEELKEEVLKRNFPWIKKNEINATSIHQSKLNETENPNKQKRNKKPFTENKTETQTIKKGAEDSIKKTNENVNSYPDNFVYVTKEEDVNFGKIKVFDPMTGQGCEIWGPDNSERAKNLRKKIFK